MEVNHPFVSGGLMKPVDVLGQDESDLPIASSLAKARWVSLGRA